MNMIIPPNMSLSEFELTNSKFQYLPVLCNGTLRPHVIFVEAATEERIKELKQTNLEELPLPQRKLHVSLQFPPLYAFFSKN